MAQNQLSWRQIPPRIYRQDFDEERVFNMMMTKKTCNLKDEHGATESSSSSAFVRARVKNQIKLNNIRYLTYGRGYFWKVKS